MIKNGFINADRCKLCGGLGAVSAEKDGYDFSFACDECFEGRSMSPIITRWSLKKELAGFRLIPQFWRAGDGSLESFNIQTDQLREKRIQEKTA
jgi:hypothetical protein